MTQKFLRANDKPDMTKELRRAIMRRSTLKSRYLEEKSEESLLKECSRNTRIASGETLEK